jgi:hypothetical protein
VDTIAVEKLEHAILSAQQVDAKFIYTVLRTACKPAAAAHFEEVDKYRRQAAEAQGCTTPIQSGRDCGWAEIRRQGFEMMYRVR